MKKFKKYIFIIIAIIILILIDQTIKIFIQNNCIQKTTIIENVLQINYSENDGIAFGWQSGNLLQIVITDILVILVLVKFIISQMGNMSKLAKISIVITLAGGISNLIDRLFRTKVVDYIDVSPLIHNFPIFNFADCLIVIGFIIFAITVAIEIFDFRPQKRGGKKLDKENNS